MTKIQRMTTFAPEIESECWGGERTADLSWSFEAHEFSCSGKENQVFSSSTVEGRNNSSLNWWE
jgi:hypothetical protein